MHANVDELLDIIDGEQSAMREHVSECERCQAMLDELKAFKSHVSLDMFDAADKVPSEDAWLRIQDALDESQTMTPNNVHVLPTSDSQPLVKAVYALAASIAFVGVVTVFMFIQQQNNQLQTQVMQASLNELMLNSRGLEQVLQKVSDQNQALSVANQKAADRLYWKLTYVDQLIDQEDPDNSERIEALWSDRIDALNALNQIYYQHGGAPQAPEI